jgi:hypothetical protein
MRCAVPRLPEAMLDARCSMLDPPPTPNRLLALTSGLHAYYPSRSNDTWRPHTKGPTWTPNPRSPRPTYLSPLRACRTASGRIRLPTRDSLPVSAAESPTEQSRQQAPEVLKINRVKLPDLQRTGGDPPSAHEAEVPARPPRSARMAPDAEIGCTPRSSWDEATATTWRGPCRRGGVGSAFGRSGRLRHTATAGGLLGSASGTATSVRRHWQSLAQSTDVGHRRWSPSLVAAHAPLFDNALSECMSVPGTAADVATSCSDEISTVPGTGARIPSAREAGTPAQTGPPCSGRVEFSNFEFRISNFLPHPGPSTRSPRSLAQDDTRGARASKPRTFDVGPSTLDL